eukprot:3110169-Lingulodinium_polyedra.AAC.1
MTRACAPPQSVRCIIAAFVFTGGQRPLAFARLAPQPAWRDVVVCSFGYRAMFGQPPGHGEPLVGQ